MKLALKGPKAMEELEDAQNAISILGGQVIKTESIDLSGNDRVNIVVQKIKKTKNKYPRGKNLPKKSPL